VALPLELLHFLLLLLMNLMMTNLLLAPGTRMMMRSWRLVEVV